MAEISRAELRARVLETFGRDLADSEIERYRGRWLSMLRAVTTLREWEERLGDGGPAAVYRPPREEADGGVQ